MSFRVGRQYHILHSQGVRVVPPRIAARTLRLDISGLRTEEFERAERRIALDFFQDFVLHSSEIGGELILDTLSTGASPDLESLKGVLYLFFIHNNIETNNK